MRPKRIHFIGWQTGIDGEPLCPLFNVVGGPYDGSTVSDKTLESWGVEVPDVGTDREGPSAKASPCRQDETGH